MDRRASIDVRQAYEVIAVIGQGTQATVKLARHRATQTLVAVKSISKPLRTDNVDIGDKSLPFSSASSPGGGHGVGQNFQAVRENVLVECRILEQMDGHPCIPRFYELLESSTSWHVVQELIRGPTLEAYLWECGGSLSETVANNIIASILYTLASLHAKGCVHRDLKPSNIILRNGNPSEVVLVDFGSAFYKGKRPSVEGGQSSLEAMQTICGTPYYLSPELVKGVAYTSKVDLWSVGCIAHALLYGKSPFEGSKNFAELYVRITRADFTFPDIANGPSEKARSFVRYLLQADSSMRPEAGLALAHAWVSPPTPTLLEGKPEEVGFLVQFDHVSGSLCLAFPVQA